jgi:hypothetical protein
MKKKMMIDDVWPAGRTSASPRTEKEKRERVWEIVD